jgi:hypothetical protein
MYRITMDRLVVASWCLAPAIVGPPRRHGPFVAIECVVADRHRRWLCGRVARDVSTASGIVRHRSTSLAICNLLGFRRKARARAKAA